MPQRMGVLRHARAMLKVGAIGFGGGSALLPVLEKELVLAPPPGEGLSDEEFIQDTVIANITPGALPPKIASLSGAQLHGPSAAVIGPLAVAAPGAIGTVALIALFAQLGTRAVQLIEFASVGVSAFILYLLAHYCIKVLAPGGRLRWSAVVIAVLAFILTGTGRTVDLILDVTGSAPSRDIPELSALGLVVLSLLAIALFTLWQAIRGRGKPQERMPRSSPPAMTRRAVRSVIALVLVVGVGVGVAFAALPTIATLQLLALMAVSTVSSFGGGEAYVGVADGFFVATGVVQADVFYGQIVPVANALPGPILIKIAAAIGYVVGNETATPLVGAALALGISLITIGVGSALAVGVLAGYDRAGNSRFIRNISAYILPVICGLLASTSISLLHACARIGENSGLPSVLPVAIALVLAAAVPLIQRLRKMPDVVLILAFGLATLLLLSILTW